MSVRSFLDTNVLVYSDDHDAPRKQRRSLELIAEARRGRTGAISTQVLSEYFATVTRKLGVAAEVARRKVELFAHLDLVLLGRDDVLAAIDLHRLHGLSFWDALIVHAARIAGSAVLYSEDLQHGALLGGVPVVNPFLAG